MERVSIRHASYGDVEYISQRVREPDRKEVWASNFLTPDVAMFKGIAHSDHAFTAVIDGEPVCMFGVVCESMIHRQGTPWMIGTDALDRKPAPFLRHCREQLMAFLSKYDILENHVDARNVKAIRWLRWMGFSIDEKPEPYGALKLPFYKFSVRRSECALY